MPLDAEHDPPGGDQPKQPTRPTAPAKPSLIGMKLGGRYLIERQLGRGGMGAVYLARDKPELHSRPVVVKVLLEEGLRNELVIGRFQREIESMTRLDDPGIVGIFDAGTLDDGSPYLVMQYVDGSTLRALIKPEGIDLAEAADIIRQVGRSVTAAHDSGILHRDLKPENIMLRTTKSGERQVKIIDFGIAKVRNSVSGQSTATGMTAGTIGYMSPEQFSARPLTATSDIYALGVIAYEMVTGRKPFTPDSIYQLLDMQRAGVRVKPADLRPSLPEEAQEIILKALSFDPEDRFQRAQDFGEQLGRALNAEYDAGEVTTRDMPEGKAADASRKKQLPPTIPVRAKGEPASLETAHVLFSDIVGYSKLLIDEQSERLVELQEIVRNTPEFQRAQAAGQLLRLPTGDGMALSFFGDPEAPVRCAVEIAKELKTHPKIRLRMGVNSGLVYRIEDINANMNVAGGGINMAQRVMDCGDAGHIIVSKRDADDLSQLSRWSTALHDLGEVEVKHLVRVHVYNLYTEEVGNPELPAKFQRPETPPESAQSPTLQTAHVLFMDIVSYSSMLIDEQSDRLKELKDIVRGTQEFQNAQGAGELLSLPTGDGMALSFFRDPESPVRCAVEVSRSLREHPGIKLRMGVNSGLVHRINDVNENLNISGGGINMAQRVMDCGDAGHILLSKRVADDLGQLGRWKKDLHDLGEAVVKHGDRVHIYNLYNDEIGNAEVPAKLGRTKSQSGKTVRWLAVAAALVVVLTGGFFLARNFIKVEPIKKTNSISDATAASPRVFTYFLTPAGKSNSAEDERFTGNERFRNGDRFLFVLTPEQSGSLYLLDRGVDANNRTSWYVLFPAPENNAGSSTLGANQRMEAKIKFDTTPGSEYMSIIWAAQPIPDLEKICKDAARTDFEIKNPAQIETISSFLTKHESPLPKAETDSDRKQTTVRGQGDLVVYQGKEKGKELVLKHMNF
jgi:serine/threonine protein kinase/predicted aspartyl protease